ncbi:MAG: glycosyltransferase family 2 protein [Lentisphaeria bacterium]|nr:glycosyltransferase family 2 protein [Lentisphaeria bacterium]
MTIDILLATFNSERFLASQLDSILEQEDRDWRLLIRDGGSTDGTPAVLEAYRRRYPDRIRLLPGGRASARENFAALMEASEAELIMFSDHDDCWLPSKVSRSRAAFEKRMAELPEGTPLLLFSDLVVAGEKLEPISESFYRHENISPGRLELRQLLLQNVAPGCAMLFNRPLRDLALPVPAEAFMHDHWLMLTAACFGKIELLPEPTLLYRQHGDNIFGASGYGAGYFCRKLSLGVKEIRARLFRQCFQAEAFRVRFRERLSPERSVLLEDFARLPKAGFLERRRILCRHRIYKSGFLRNFGMFLIV